MTMLRNQINIVLGSTGPVFVQKESLSEQSSFKNKNKKSLKKIFIEFVTTLFLFYILVFWPKAHEILALQPGIKPTPPVLKEKS